LAIAFSREQGREIMQVGIFGLPPQIGTEQLRVLLEGELRWFEESKHRRPDVEVALYDDPPSWSERHPDVRVIFRGIGSPDTEEIVFFLLNSMAIYIHEKEPEPYGYVITSLDWETVH